MLECIYDWTINRQSLEVTDIIYFDFNEAFYSVSHLKLSSKLQAYGIAGNLLDWITNLLSNRTRKVKINNILSHIVDVSSGVPRGSLGPTLFLYLLMMYVILSIILLYHANFMLMI